MSLNCPHAWEEYKKFDLAYDDLRREYLALRAEQANFTNVPKEWLEKMREFRLKCKAVGKNWQNNLENKFRDVFFAKNIVQFKEQYHTQYENLKKLKLLRLLPESKKMGIIGIDDKEYPIPTWQHIQTMIADNREKYETKMSQGFTKLQLTPFALPLSEMIITAERELINYNKKNKLKKTTEISVDKNWWDRYGKPTLSADKLGGIKYYPKAFKSGMNEGLTKSSFLDKQREAAHHSLAGWQVLLVENNFNLTPEYTDKIVEERKPFKLNEEPSSCLKKLKNDPQYVGEQGLTIEDWLCMLMNDLLDKKPRLGDIITDKGYDIIQESYLLSTWKMSAKKIACCGVEFDGENLHVFVNDWGIDNETYCGVCHTAVGIS